MREGERREKRGKGKGERGGRKERGRERGGGWGKIDTGNLIGKNENIFSENNIFHSLYFSLFIVTSAAATGRSSSQSLSTPLF
jgi:hypothetical protein